MKLSKSASSCSNLLPDVSIVMTVFNTSAYLAEAIESVLDQQTSAAWELLIIDDGSTDGSRAIADAFAERFKGNIFVLQHRGRENRGTSASRNLGLTRARAPITAFLDADDVWLPDRIQSQLPFLLENHEVAMVYAQAERWLDFDQPYDPINGSKGNNFVPPLIPPGEHGGMISPPMLLEWFLEDESLTPCTCCVLVRTAVARELGGFVNQFTGLYDDQVFYAKFALREKIFVSLDCVARYRRHAQSCCAVAMGSVMQDEAEKQFRAWLEEYQDFLEAGETVSISLKCEPVFMNTEIAMTPS